MATNPIGPHAEAVTLPGTIPAMPVVARILARYDREKVEAFVSVAIDLLDVLDGDPDFENATDLEDDHALSPQAYVDKRPGCKISDPAESDDDDSAVDDRNCDDINDDREEESDVFPDYPIDQASGALPQALAEDRSLMRPHLQRIRAERCDKIRYPSFGGGYVEYRLRGGDA